MVHCAEFLKLTSISQSIYHLQFELNSLKDVYLRSFLVLSLTNCSHPKRIPGPYTFRLNWWTDGPQFSFIKFCFTSYGLQMTVVFIILPLNQLSNIKNHSYVHRSTPCSCIVLHLFNSLLKSFLRLKWLFEATNPVESKILLLRSALFVSCSFLVRRFCSAFDLFVISHSPFINHRNQIGLKNDFFDSPSKNEYTAFDLFSFDLFVIHPFLLFAQFFISLFLIRKFLSFFLSFVLFRPFCFVPILFKIFVNGLRFWCSFKFVLFRSTFLSSVLYRQRMVKISEKGRMKKRSKTSELQKVDSKKPIALFVFFGES